MKKAIGLLLSIALCCLLSLPVAADSEGPAITLEIQSPVYTEYGVAIYTVKAEGENLRASWWMEWQGTTYLISENAGAMQPWEGYAGESYGPNQLDDNTFAFIFEGIEAELNNASIWCVATDGNYSITSQTARILVDGVCVPPEIVSIPYAITVEQGEEAEMRCVARSTDESQLSFLWYETDTGKLEDIRAVNRGEETSDTLICDTSELGTRNYLCMVTSQNGGAVYSSVVPVTVVERTSEPVSSEPEQNSSEAASEIESSSSEIESSSSEDVSTVTSEGVSSETVSEEQKENGGFPLWAMILIGIAAAGLGFGVPVILLTVKK